MNWKRLFQKPVEATLTPELRARIQASFDEASHDEEHFPATIDPRIETAEEVRDRVLAEVGPRLPTVDAVTARLLDDVRNRTGTYVNGEGEKGPNPYWP